MNNHQERPLSPHLQIYKWQWSSVSSIMNRLTGILFFFGIVFFSFWIFSAYIGGTTFAWTAWLLSSPFGLFAQFAFLWILSYHSLQGLQHLLWDAGFLFNLSLPQHSIRSLIIAAASILLALFLFFLTR